MAGLVALLQVMISRFHFYFSYPTTTTVHLLEEYTPDFPAVTVCNLNNVNRTLLEQQDPLLIRVAQTLLPLKFEPANPINISDPMIAQQISNIYYSEIYKRVKLNMDGVLNECYFNQELYPCEDIMTPVYTDRGECYTFHSAAANRTFKTYSTGVSNGLELKINLHQESYYSGTAAAGVMVSIILVDLD